MGKATGFSGLSLLKSAVQSLLILGVIAGTGWGEIDVKLETVPLGEHPRPDLQRQVWLNLNGRWYRFQVY